jgi:cytochrome b
MQGLKIMKISENSTISITIFWVLLGAALGVTGWMTKLHFMTESNANTLEVVKDKQEEYSRDIAEIKADIRVIKTILEGEK